MFGRKENLAGIARCAIDLQLDIAPDHQFGELICGGVFGFQCANRASPLDNGDAIADGGYFSQFMGNENDRAAVSTEALRAK